MEIEARLEQLGLTLPRPVQVPSGVTVPFSWVRISGDRALVSGHGPLNLDGTPAGPFGKVEADVSLEQAYQAARGAALAMLASLQRALGDLDRVTAWLIVHGFVNALPGSTQTTNVINGFSDLILELYGDGAGKHARTAIGVEALPLNLPVVIEAEVQIAPPRTTATND
jgi:enamine deaminase RidA (YjgF/YER057c/UK114 family)